MIEFPDYKEPIKFDQPIFIKMQYKFNDQPTSYYKIKGYRKDGWLYGTCLSFFHIDNSVHVRTITSYPYRFKDTQNRVYSLMTEDEYNTVFGNAITFYLE